jgi:hypothetical protein
MARLFNGTSDYIASNGAGVGSGSVAFSVAVWLRCANTVTNAVFYGEGNSGSTTPFLQLQCDSGKFRISQRRTGNSGTSDINAITSTSILADSTWRHIIYASSISGSTITGHIYIDGVDDATVVSHATFSQTLNTVNWGALSRTTTVNFWAGNLAHGATWKRALSAREAKLLAGGASPLLLAADHYWPLWGKDSPEPDLGALAHVAGTLTGTDISTVGAGKSIPSSLWIP